MRFKNLLTVAALLLVAAGIVALTIKVLHRPQTLVEAAQRKDATQTNSCSCAERIIVYYFHRTVRCPTCVQVESSAKEAIESLFSEPLKDGRLEWRSVNYEEQGNEQYATDYKIAGPCLVLVRMKGGKPVEWRNLPEVWTLVGDKRAFVHLILCNVQEFLNDIVVPGACCT
jgi:hypothetical protein